jgi:hypothetical protein
MKHAIRSGVSSRDFFSVDEIGRISDGLLGTASASELLRMLSLQNAWNRAVGLHLRMVARPSSLRGARLVVEVRDQAWKRELDRLKPEILRRLATLLPSHPIADIVFRLMKSAAGGSVAAQEPADEPRQSREEAAGPASAGGHAAERRRGESAGMAAGISPPMRSVPHDDLRERFSDVMGRYLARAH